MSLSFTWSPVGSPNVKKERWVSAMGLLLSRLPERKPAPRQALVCSGVNKAASAGAPPPVHYCHGFEEKKAEVIYYRLFFMQNTPC